MNTEPAAEISAIAAWLAETTGISTGIIGLHSLRRAIGLRRQVLGLQESCSYRETLLASPDEQQCLVELLVVPETWFFRDRHPFSHLREHVSGLLQEGLPQRPLRLLSAPCATGEEPYSMAMTLLDMGLSREAFSIDAIDICRASIRKARHAVYGRHSFRGVSQAEQQQYFVHTDEGLSPRPEICEMVHFRRGNLMQCLQETASQYDVIFCRNLLIYLEDAASQHLLESFASLMKPGGLLIVGSAEPGKVPSTLFSSIRASFVFGFLRRELSSELPVPTAAAPHPVNSLRASAVPERRPRPSRAARPSEPLPRRSASGRSSRVASASSGASAAAMAELDYQRYQKDLERDPCSDVTYLRLAQWLLKHDRREEALQCFQKCLYLKPDCLEALQALIQLSDQLGQAQRRRQFEARLARLQP